MRSLIAVLLALFALPLFAEGLTAERLGVLYNMNDAASVRIAQYYAARRGIPRANLVGLAVPDRAVIGRDELKALRQTALGLLPAAVQSLLLVWSRPYAVECMSITTAFAAGYQASFCEPGCARTADNPLFDSAGWLPADTLGWLPAMLLPSHDESLAKAVIDRGIKADGTNPNGTAYLITTQDSLRNVRTQDYVNVPVRVRNAIKAVRLTTPINDAPHDVLAYFTGVVRVDELARVGFLPGAAADHLTSTGGALETTRQMSALEWLRQGATASYGSVSEPCNLPAKFPSPAVFLGRYTRGDTLLEAYWKSVAMPGQGLFIGEPLARPYTTPR